MNKIVSTYNFDCLIFPFCKGECSKGKGLEKNKNNLRKGSVSKVCLNADNADNTDCRWFLFY